MKLISLRKFLSNARGNFGHKGRPGLVGGSSPRGSHHDVSSRKRDELGGLLDSLESQDVMDVAVLSDPTKYGEYNVSFGGRQIGTIIPIATYPGMDPEKKYGAYFYTERGNHSQMKQLYSSPQEAADALKLYAKKHPKRKTRMERFFRNP